MSRPFVFDGASTLKVGMTITYVAGFHKWENQTLGPTVKSAAQGISTTLYYVLDEAIMLTAAASVAVLSVFV